jgi:hypothetical protein
VHPEKYLHHDRKKHHTRTQIEEYNIFRDSPLRYMGYANEVGESFRYQFPKFVVPSYVLSFGYCLADAAMSGRKAYNDAQNHGAANNTHSSVAIATVDTLVWQSLASVLIPGATINTIVKSSRWALASSPRPLPSPVVTWLPTAIGLGSIPLIIHPIDEGVDWFMEQTFRKAVHLSSMVVKPAEYNHQQKTAPTTEHAILSNALGSATAGIIARVTTHPLDTAKARLQSVSGSSYRGPMDVLYQTFRTEGVGGLYRGFSTVIVGGTPGTIVYLCSYDIFKDKISSITSSSSQQCASSQDSFMVHFLSGILAETVACLIYVPVDVIKERLQIQHKRDSFQYKGGWDALVQISKNEGLRGIYKGYGATLASFGPFSALYFMFYEKFKLWSKQYDGQESMSLPFQWTVISSAGAGALASFLTSPLDMAKLRLQVQRGSQKSASSTTSYRGISDALSSAFQSGGVQGIFRGAGARMLHFVPATTISMTTYETCRSFFQEVLK